MRFWDSSAIVPLLVEQPRSKEVAAHLRANPEVCVWWGTPVECASAIARLERDGLLDEPEARKAFGKLERLSARWQEVEPGDVLRDLARRLLRTHAIRAADALQLAAALVAAEQRPQGSAFLCLDEKLAAAAAREGFHVIGGT